MTAYADVYDLEARLSTTYPVPGNAEQLLEKASEVINDAMLGRAAVLFASSGEADVADIDALARATCDQVEFWIEAGEEHDVLQLRGSLVAGRVQVHPVAGVLAPRARRTLRLAGLFSLGVDIL